VEERLRYLSNIANSGDKPGRFANLLNFGQGLTSAYLAGGIPGADRFAGLTSVNQVAVTGRAYSWMTDKDYYNPGGNFVTIPDAQQGLLGQFFGGVASPGTSAVAVDVHHSRLHFSMGEKTNWNPAFSHGLFMWVQEDDWMRPNARCGWATRFSTKAGRLGYEPPWRA
jgi:hypothetical protein